VFRFSPLSLYEIALHEDEIFMLVRGQYDGGNEANSLIYSHVTLAALYGTTAAWKPFDHAWPEMLKRNRADYLHTTDLMTFNGPYSKGWDDRRRNLFLNECADVITRLAQNPHTKKTALSVLVPYSVTIDLKDFKRIQAEFTDGPQDATDGLATQALSEIVQFCQSINGDFIHMVFDRNEPYIGHVRNRINNPKYVKGTRDGGFDFARRIPSVTEADSRSIAGLQAADFLAWCVTRKGEIRDDWHDKIVKMDRRQEWLDYDQLRKFRRESLEAVARAKLPRRRPTR